MQRQSKTWPSPRERTLGQILRRKAADNPDKTFVVFKDSRWTYAEFDRWVDRISRGLVKLGATRGSKVAVMLPNCAEFVGVWFACARIGAIEVPVNTNLRGPLLKHVVGHSDSEILVASVEHLGEIGKVVGDLPALASIVLCGEEKVNLPGAPSLRQMLFTEIEDEDSSPFQHDVEPWEPLAIVFTSGTTGPSKGAVLSHEYFWWFGERSCELRKMTDSEVLYTCLPLFHANAQVLTTMPALLRGQTAVLDAQFTASGFWDRIRSFGATQFNYIGGMIPILMKQPERPEDAENPIRIALGAAAPGNQWEAFETRFGLRLVECYGQTENCVATVNPLEVTRIGSIGKAEWGYEMRVIDDHGHEVPDGTIGEFVVRPQWPGIMMLGYYKMPEATLEALRNLWFHTGDYGSRDKDGYFYFMDRKKDAIRRRGENISAYEVEVVVNSHAAVIESAVFAVPSDVGEDDVMVTVVLKDGMTPTAAELLQYCEENLAYFALPRYVEFAEELPKTPTYKVEKYKLRQRGVTPATWDREKAGYKLKRS
ncbi:AMP-binding protein [Bradyrhizobium manausense]